MKTAQTPVGFWSVFSPLPVLVVDPRAVEQSGEEVLLRTQTLKHQADPVQGREQEEDECKQEAAVVGLPHTTVYPTGTQTSTRDILLRL